MELLHIDDKSFHTEVEGSKGIVVVDFFATWCGPCRMLGPVLEQVQEELGKKVKIVKLDVDEGEKTARKFGIMSVPSLVIFKDGQEVDMLVGFRPKEQLVEYLNDLIQK